MAQPEAYKHIEAIVYILLALGVVDLLKNIFGWLVRNYFKRGETAVDELRHTNEILGRHDERLKAIEANLKDIWKDIRDTNDRIDRIRNGK